MHELTREKKLIYVRIFPTTQTGEIANEKEVNGRLTGVVKDK